MRCGQIALVGRPNVGKSTLLNAIVGEQISIATHKAQTTRDVIIGVYSEQDVQMVFLDTPGIFKDKSYKYNKNLNRIAKQAMSGVDLIIHIVQADQWNSEDQFLLDLIRDIGKVYFNVINKIDLLKDKNKLLPQIENLTHRGHVTEIVPVCAFVESDIMQLKNIISKYMPQRDFLFSPEEKTPMTKEFLVSEIIREQLFLQLNEELPYALTVKIKDMLIKNNICYIHANILVQRKSQRRIVIGKMGTLIKKIGSAARHRIQSVFSEKVYLNLLVTEKDN